MLTVCTLVLGIVNAARIETIRTDVSGMDVRDLPPPTESMLIRSGSGNQMPKLGYWLAVKHAESTTDWQKLTVQTDAATDESKLFADIATGRITHIYNPDNRRVFEINKATSSGGNLSIKPLSGVGTLLASTASDFTHLTLIGIPESTSPVI